MRGGIPSLDGDLTALANGVCNAKSRSDQSVRETMRGWWYERSVSGCGMWEAVIMQHKKHETTTPSHTSKLKTKRSIIRLQ